MCTASVPIHMCALGAPFVQTAKRTVPICIRHEQVPSHVMCGGLPCTVSLPPVRVFREIWLGSISEIR